MTIDVGVEQAPPLGAAIIPSGGHGHDEHAQLDLPRRTTGSSCDWSTRWTRTTRCSTRSTSTAPGASWCWRATESTRRTSWKDTMLVRTGQTVDVLLDVTNPGRWMAHCHIAEHHESGMMFSFDVEPA